jgi:hypothetical protein
MACVVVRLALGAALLPQLATAEGPYTYPEYERADVFSAPCGWEHTGSDTSVRGQLLSKPTVGLYPTFLPPSLTGAPHRAGRQRLGAEEAMVRDC